MPHCWRPSISRHCSPYMEQSATCRPLCNFFEHLQEASQDTRSLPVVIQPVFNQLLRVLEVVVSVMLNFLTSLRNMYQKSSCTRNLHEKFDAGCCASQFLAQIKWRRIVHKRLFGLKSIKTPISSMFYSSLRS